jgi:hypothetical protein
MLKSFLLFKIMLTLLLLLAMAYLTRVGVAEFIRLRPCAYIDAVKEGKVKLDAAELDRSRALLFLARSWDVGNPVVPEYLAQTDFMLAQMVSFSPSIQANFLHDAIVNLDSAITLRPNSAFLWAARMTMGSWLLQLKIQTNKSVDKSELSSIVMAMRRADVLDPWEPSILQQVVKVGTLRYKEFVPEVRLVVDGAVMRAKKLNITI